MAGFILFSCRAAVMGNLINSGLRAGSNRPNLPNRPNRKKEPTEF